MDHVGYVRGFFGHNPFCGSIPHSDSLRGEVHHCNVDQCWRSVGSLLAEQKNWRHEHPTGFQRFRLDRFSIRKQA